MKRLVGYNHFTNQSYDIKYDEYCALLELGNDGVSEFGERSKKFYFIFYYR